jgi:T5orf172 domain
MASDKEPARNTSSYYANQLPQSLSDSSIVKHSLPSVYELPSQAQSTPAIHNGTFGVPRIPSKATTPDRRALRSSSSSSQQDPGAKATRVDENGKDESLTEIAKDIEETIGVETKSKPATNRRQEPGNQQNGNTTRGVEIPASTPLGPGDPRVPVAKRPASSHRSSGTQQFLNSASTPTVQLSTTPSATPKSPVPKIKLHHSDADKDWNDGLDHATSSTAPNNPLENSDISTPSDKGDESFFGSSLLLEGGFDSDPDSPDDFDSDPDSQDDSLALVLPSPSPTPHRRSVSSDLIYTPPGGLNVIWNWVTSKRRDKHVQPFFWIANLLCRPLADRDILEGYVYAFKVKDPQGRGYIKIGVTKGRLVNRMKAHSVCYGDCEQIYPPTDEKPALVNHARRVEQLVHAELVEQSIYLEKCPKARQRHNCHGEWFDVDPRHAMSVIRKWSEWMKGDPYEERPIPLAKITKRTSADGAMKMAWELGVLHQDVITRLCWPTATAVDDDEISGLEEGMGLLTFG